MIATGLSMVPLVSPMEMGMALALFRGAVMDDPTQATVAPLTDEYVRLCLSDEPLLKLGMGVLEIHYGLSDTPHPAIRRMESFVALLRRVSDAPVREWKTFQQTHNRFAPVVHAIAWCPLENRRPFAIRDFIKIAVAAPFSLQVSSSRAN